MMAGRRILYLYEGVFMMYRRRLEGIYRAVSAEGWSVDVVNVDDAASSIRKVLDCWQADGIVIEGGLMNRRGADVLRKLKTPKVICDVDESKMEGPYFGVIHDSFDTVAKACRELLGGRYESFAYVHYRIPRDWSFLRERQFRECLGNRQRRLTVFNPLKRGKVVRLPEFMRLLKEFLIALPRPCGLLASTDSIAALVLRAAGLAGIAVPEELAVVGIDNDELLCENTVPTLTSVAPDVVRSGELAVGLLKRQFADPFARPEVLTFGSAPLVRRHSSRVLERRDIRAVKAIEFIRVNACRGLTAADVVRSMGLSTRMAQLRFRSVTGHSIMQEINAVRLARAKELIAAGRIPLGQVYEFCGYKDARSLRRAFERCEKRSMSSFRK